MVGPAAPLLEPSIPWTRFPTHRSPPLSPGCCRDTGLATGGYAARSLCEPVGSPVTQVPGAPAAAVPQMSRDAVPGGRFPLGVCTRVVRRLRPRWALSLHRSGRVGCGSGRQHSVNADPQGMRSTNPNPRRLESVAGRKDPRRGRKAEGRRTSPPTRAPCCPDSRPGCEPCRCGRGDCGRVFDWPASKPGSGSLCSRRCRRQLPASGHPGSRPPHTPGPLEHFAAPAPGILSPRSRG